MPREINWNNFTELEPDEREELKAFVETYGGDIEEITGIKFTEAYIRAQLKKNLDMHRRAKRQQSLEEKANDRQKKHKTSGKKEAISRGVRLYLTDNEEDNRALMKSLETKEGEKKFLHRMVKDLMSLELSEEAYDPDPSAGIRFLEKNGLISELAFIVKNLYDAVNTGENKLEEPLLSELADLKGAFEKLGDIRSKKEYMASPFGLLLPPQEQKKMMELADKIMEQSRDKGPESRAYVPLVMFISTDGPITKEAEITRDNLAKKGYLKLGVRMQDENKKPVTRGEAMALLTKGKTVSAKEPDPELAENIQNQLASLDIYKSPGELEEESLQKKAADFKTELKTIHIDCTDKMIRNMRNLEAVLAFGKDEDYPRWLHFDTDTKSFKLSEPISKLPEAPKEPTFPKNILHFFFGFFQKDYDRYYKARREHLALSDAYGKSDVQTKIQERTEQKKKQENLTNPTNRTRTKKEILEVIDDGRINLIKEGASPSMVIKTLSEDLHKKMGALRQRIEEGREMKEYQEDHKLLLAELCVFEIIKKEYNDSKENGYLAKHLQEEIFKAGRENKGIASIDLIREVLNSKDFKDKTQDMTANGIADFIGLNSAHKVLWNIGKNLNMQQNSPQSGNNQPQMQTGPVESTKRTSRELNP